MVDGRLQNLQSSADADLTCFLFGPLPLFCSPQYHQRSSLCNPTLCWIFGLHCYIHPSYLLSSTERVVFCVRFPHTLLTLLLCCYFSHCCVSVVSSAASASLLSCAPCCCLPVQQSALCSSSRVLLSPHAAAALVSCQSVALLARHLTSAAADRVSPAKSAVAAAGGEREVIGVPLLFKEVNPASHHYQLSSGWWDTDDHQRNPNSKKQQRCSSWAINLWLQFYFSSPERKLFFVF